MQLMDRSDTLLLEDFAAELLRQQQAKVDYVADTRRIGFHCEEPGQAFVTIDGSHEAGGFAVLKKAHEQFASRLKIPRAYYERMLAEAPTLLQRNVRHWLLENPEPRMFRTLDGDLRAVLSDRYRRLDTFDLMEHLLPEFSTIDGLSVHVASLTPERAYIRAILPSLSAEIRVGDVVQAGVEISNSEVGSGALQVRPYLWRLWCLNGMVRPVALRKYHIGRRIEESEEAYAIFRDETMRQDDKAVFMKAADLVRACLTEATFEQIVGDLRGAANSEPIQNPVAATKVLANRLGLNETEEGSFLHHLATGGDLTRWGAVNALTAAAKSAPTFDRLVEMEALGGALASAPENEWALVAAAA